MSVNDQTFETGAQKKKEEKKPANRHAPKRDHGGRAKILEIEASAKRKLEEMQEADNEVIRKLEEAIQRTRNTTNDPVALRAYTLQRYKKLREDLEQEEEQRLADSADEAEDELREVDLAQQAYRNKQKEIWKFEELEEVKILRAEKMRWLERTAKMEDELEAAKQTIERLEKAASQDQITINALRGQIAA